MKFSMEDFNCALQNWKILNDITSKLNYFKLMLLKRGSEFNNIKLDLCRIKQILIKEFSISRYLKKLIRSKCKKF